MSETPANRKSAPKNENPHLFGIFRWPIVLVLALVTGFAVSQLHPDLFGLVLLAKEVSSHAWSLLIAWGMGVNGGLAGNLT